MDENTETERETETETNEEGVDADETAIQKRQMLIQELRKMYQQHKCKS